MYSIHQNIATQIANARTHTRRRSSILLELMKSNKLNCSSKSQTCSAESGQSGSGTSTTDKSSGLCKSYAYGN